MEGMSHSVCMCTLMHVCRGVYMYMWIWVYDCTCSVICLHVCLCMSLHVDLHSYKWVPTATIQWSPTTGSGVVDPDIIHMMFILQAH